MRPLLLLVAVVLCGLLVSGFAAPHAGKSSGNPKDDAGSFARQDTEIPTGRLGLQSGASKDREAPETGSTITDGRCGDSEHEEQGQKKETDNVARTTRDVGNMNMPGQVSSRN
ncbi:uncharacterized protein LOC125943954 [Dermacentor silvarum]|uniref:uncharacterized protein LOC125943954 n=1 Tax=Dermacentor silvarum TaxID=543639 RepID=UPI0021008E8C|nr:uncharacterized protein LOC125943954 [Dermacentor silvarum]